MYNNMMVQHGYNALDELGNFIGSVLWIVVLVAIIVFIVRMMGGGRMHHHRHWMGGGAPWMNQNALEILRERFAKGEISKEEYEERRKVLSEDK